MLYLNYTNLNKPIMNTTQPTEISNQVIAKCISRALFTLHEFGYSDATVDNIWFDNIFYDRLRLLLQDYYYNHQIDGFRLFFKREILKKSPQVEETIPWSKAAKAAKAIKASNTMKESIRVKLNTGLKIVVAGLFIIAIIKIFIV